MWYKCLVNNSHAVSSKEFIFLEENYKRRFIVCIGTIPIYFTVFDDDDDDYPVPPYMPIQGQRRTASLEKNRRLKPPKEKSNSKDSCKQQ